MEIGEYEIVVEDREGRTARRLSRVARAGRPLVGEWVDLEGERYRVEEVVHADENAVLEVPGTIAHIFVRHVGPAPGRRPLSEDADVSLPRVLPFTVPPGRRGRLPQDFESLIMGVVIAGYLEQIEAFSHWRLHRQPARFLGEDGPTASWVAREFRRLAREAEVAWEAAQLHAATLAGERGVARSAPTSSAGSPPASSATQTTERRALPLLPALPRGVGA